MTKSKFIRLGGWSLILGALTFPLFFLGVYLENNVYDPFRRFQAFSEFSLLVNVWLTPVLLGIGMLGLRARYGDEVGGFGKNILLLGAITDLPITMIGVVTAETTEWGWVLLFAGNAFLLTCLAIFGVLALRVKPLPRWNWLPFIAGIGFPIFLPLGLILNENGTSGDLISNLSAIFVTIQCIALFMLGYVLQSNMPDDSVVPA